jgi:hypothetical protein
MAKVYKNIIIKGLSGDLGKQLQIRTSKITGQTYVFAKTNFETRRKDSPAQQAQKQAFWEASAYADAHQTDPIYIAKAKGRKGKERQPRNVAMADWFHPPSILEIDLGGWRGAAGELIRILAADDVRVAQVRVEIRDESGASVEAGEATLRITQWWEYAVQGAMRGELSVTAFASDLPGHVTQASERKIILG